MRYSLSTTARKLPLDRFRGGVRTDQEQDVLPTLSGYIKRVLVRKVLFQALLALMVVTSGLAHGIGPLFFLSLVAFVSASLEAWGSYTYCTAHHVLRFSLRLPFVVRFLVLLYEDEPLASSTINRILKGEVWKHSFPWQRPLSRITHARRLMGAIVSVGTSKLPTYF